MRKFLLAAMLCGFFVMCLQAKLLAQNLTVTGTVTDQEGAGLPGVSVFVKNSQVGSFSDGDGKYSIQAPANAVLVFTFLGMEKQEVLVNGKTSISVIMKSLSTDLNEVVVVGYGKSKKGDLTVAQTSLSAKDLNQTVNTTLEQAIQGRAAGVYITQNSGQPGGGISVNIRGVNSINGSNEPLYVIDGVQIQPGNVSFGAQSSSNTLAGINPSDIEDVQILQGPSATAIYGSRATNGVVLITTKRGKSGEVKINYAYQHSLQTPPERLTVMNLRQYAQMVNEYHAIAGGETPQEFLDPSLLGNGTDWQKELFSNAGMNKHLLNLSGGSDNTTYYMSGDYLKQEGVAAGSGFDRYSFRLNLDNKPKKWATIGLNLSFNQTSETLTTSQENIISNALQLTPQIPVKNLDGTWGGGDDNNGANIFAPVNPIAIANLTTNRNKRRQFLGGIDLGIQIFKDLKFKTAFNTNVGYANSVYYIPTYKIGWAQNVSASLKEGANLNTYWNFNQQLEYNKTFSKHTLNVTAVHEAQESLWKNLMGGREGFLTNDILDLDAGDALTSVTGGGAGDWAMESYLGRVNYNYDSRYIFTGTLRADASSNFGSENKWGIFPSASFAWRLSEESFFNIPFINDFKIRLETGETGNQGSSGYIYSPLSSAPTPTGTGFLLSRYDNPGLKWESTRTDNLGINLSLLRSRVEITADLYVKNTDNLLLVNPLPWYMGSNGNGSIGAPMVNIGSLKNTGWSFSINTVNIDKSDFVWSSQINLSHFKTTIKKFNSDVAVVDRSSWWLSNWTQRSAVGQAPWLFRGYIEDGIFQSVDEIANSPVPIDNNGDRLPIDQNNGVWVGDVKYKDVSGPNGEPDGIIDGQDMTYIGNPWPKLFGGLTNNFSYKGFDLNILLTGTFGNDVYNYLARTNSNPNNINLSRNLLIEATNYARPVTAADGSVSLENPGTNVARITNGPNGNYERITNKWVQNGSFVRLKNVSLAYNLPKSIISKQKLVRGARLGFSAQNIVTITKYKGMDPEVGAYVGRDSGELNQAIGLDFGRYPLTPIYTFNIGVDF